MNKLDRAARFLFLNRFCFNGLYRTNLRGDFNVPYSPTKTGTIPSLAEFASVGKLLRNAIVRCQDFALTIEEAGSGDFIYADPPYAVRSRRVFTEYNANLFGKDDLERLVVELRRAEKRGAHFLVSYAECAEARKAFRNWHVRRVMAQRNIAGFSEHRRRAAELLVSNILPRVSK